MKKKIGLSLSAALLGYSVYAIVVLLIGCLCFNQITPWGMICSVLLLSLSAFAFVLIVKAFTTYRIGRFNIDLFLTLLMFIIFMLAFSMPSTMTVQFLNLTGWFPALGSFVTLLAGRSTPIGIYEISLFFSMLCCGMTIGEDKGRKYYE